jgi:CDGSH-type Zn-finger protein
MPRRHTGSGWWNVAEVELVVRRNGSTLVKGDVVIKDQDGNVIQPPTVPFSLCRCGASRNKPFCDGSHKAIGFDDSKTTVTA